jgi:asparagine synthase (glutamine-hydrolysing)
MSGFYGMVACRALAAADLRQLEHATNLLRHRGPDDEGYVVIHRQGKARELRGDQTVPAHSRLGHIRAALPRGESIAMGARRLALGKTWEQGHLPIYDGHGNWLVFDGAIYNCDELREQLLKLGFRFRIGCDTEVALHAYRHWGNACLEKLHGAWALALWDAAQQRLFCARDRFGEKPLYYSLAADGSFSFCSEITPLRANVPFRINHARIWDFLRYELADHTSETFFSGIQQLPAGCCLKLDPGTPPQILRYYDLHARIAPLAQDPTAAAAALRARLAEAIALQLRDHATVPIVAGDDAYTAIIEGMVEEYRVRLNRSPSQDRSPGKSPRHNISFLSRPLLQKSTQLKSHSVDDTSLGNFEQILLHMLEAQTEPVSDLSPLASFEHLRQIHQQGKSQLVLAATGSGQMLGVEPGDFSFQLTRLLTSVQITTWIRQAREHGWRPALRSSFEGLVSHLPERLLENIPGFRPPLAKLLQTDFYFRYHKRYSASERQRLPFQRRRLVDIIRFRLPRLLRQLDRNAMHFSLEVRHPFLDHRVVEFACSVPEEWKLREQGTALVRQLNTGGSVPGTSPRTLETVSPRDCLRLLKTASRLDEFIRVEDFRRHIESGGGHIGFAEWRVLLLGLWLQTIVSAQPASSLAKRA